MTRLLAPSPGECLDRITILELKIENGIRRKVEVGHFKEEQSELKQYMDNTWGGTRAYETLGPPSLKLQAVNRKLWEVEDEVRALKKCRRGEFEIQRLADIVIQITDLNDARSEWVKQINQLFGVTAQEKIYSV